MIDTHWYVLTGPPCSGKTTIIDALNKLGYTTSDEVARQYYQDLLNQARREDILANPIQLQEDILKVELAREEGLDTQELTFLDRAIPDSIAYFSRIGVVPNHVISASKTYRYKDVFFLESLPYQNDGIRQEDAKTAEQIGRLVHEAYASVGYHLKHVPVMRIEDRLAYILNEIS